MNGSLRAGKILGIDLEIHFSWLIIFIFLSYMLGEQYQNIHPGMETAYYWITSIVITLMIFVSVLLHELAHSLTAINEGISIRKITLFIFGGVAQMEKEPHTPVSEFKIAAAGPLMSLFLAGVFGAIAFFTSRSVDGLLLISIIQLASVNLIMGVFNLIPAFPLDGGRLLRASIWRFSGNLLSSTRMAVAIGSFFAFLGIAYGFFALLILGNILGLWFVFLGWMLYQAGQASYSQLLFHQAFSGVKIWEVMTTELHTVPPDMKLQELVENFYLHKVSAFPVVYGSTLHGLVSLHQIKEVPRDKWPFLTVSYIMTPLRECIVASPDEEAFKIMTKMAVENISRVLVVKDGYLEGILSRTDMMRLLKMNLILGSDRIN